ncbi:MAG: membrane protein insertion efficiency factor YidD [Bacteroidota bacterium]
MLRAAKKIGVFILLIPIRFYRLFLSPLFPGACRYAPSCSEYCAQALKKHGPIKGLVLGTKRLCSCHPWGGSGFDPVPD